jgi:hypothetical protein
LWVLLRFLCFFFPILCLLTNYLFGWNWERRLNCGFMSVFG